MYSKYSLRRQQRCEGKESEIIEIKKWCIIKIFMSSCLEAWTICTYISLTTCPLRLHRTLGAWRKFPISVSNVSICVKDGGAEKEEGGGERFAMHQNLSYSDPACEHLAKELKQERERESWTLRQKKSAIMHCINLFLSEYEKISQLTAQQSLTPLLLEQILTSIGSIMDSTKKLH